MRSSPGPHSAKPTEAAKPARDSAARSAGDAASAVPLELTRFIGRESEIDELTALLRDSRLLTLTGAGGSGKTRLAYELLRAHPPAEPVAVVELAAVSDADLLPRRVAESFDIREEIGDATELVDLLHDRRALVVLDNCEHMVEPVAHLVDALLRGCPGVRALATSREALGVKGERAWPVPALGLPPEGAAAATISSAEAVRLFVDRARDVAADFDVTADNAAAIAGICRRLDGMPLAIELAAARARVLSPEQIHDRLTDAFRLLTTGGRTTIARHRTLRATIDWSHDLLPEPARILFRRLAVFRGEFSLDAVEAVGTGAEPMAGELLDTLEQLVNRSLVEVHEHDGEARYALLEVVRQYATARLAESDDDSEARLRHARFFLAVAEAAEPHLTRTGRRAHVERLTADLENIRAALDWSRDNEPAIHIRLAGALWWFWFSTRHWMEARRWIDGALDLPLARTPGVPRARLLFAAGALAALQTRCDDAVPPLEEAASIARGAGDERLLAYAENYTALAKLQTGDLTGRPYANRALEWFRANDDLYGLRLTLLMLGSAAQFEGRNEDAERFNLEGVAVARRSGQDRDLAVALQNTAALYVGQQRLDIAARFVRESLEHLRRDPAWVFIARSIDLFAEIAGRTDPLRAARAFGAAAAIRSAIHARPFKLDADRIARLLPALREAAGDAAFDSAHAEGARLTIDEILSEILDDGAFGRPAPESTLESAAPSVTAATPADETPGTTAETTGEVDIAIHALGPVRVRIRGEPVDSWPFAKPRELLLYLAIHRHGRTRDQIGQALWPGATAKQAKNSFHVTLHHLRKVLGHPDWITMAGDRYRLDPALGVDFDADRFETAARAALRAPADDAPDTDTLRSILALHAGDLFETETETAWQEEHRDRIRRLHTDTTLLLARTLERTGETADAADLYHESTLRDDLNEEAHRGLMRCWAANGHRARALQHYDRVVEILRDAIDAEPEDETIALYRELRGQPVER